MPWPLLGRLVLTGLLSFFHKSLGGLQLFNWEYLDSTQPHRVGFPSTETLDQVIHSGDSQLKEVG